MSYVAELSLGGAVVLAVSPRTSEIILPWVSSQLACNCVLLMYLNYDYILIMHMISTDISLYGCFWISSDLWQQGSTFFWWQFPHICHHRDPDLTILYNERLFFCDFFFFYADGLGTVFFIFCVLCILGIFADISLVVGQMKLSYTLLDNFCGSKFFLQ